MEDLRETDRLNRITRAIIAAAIEVHRHLGPGLLESAYEECLCFELSRLGFRFQRQFATPVEYKGLKLDCSYRMDLLVEDTVVVEVKALEQLLPLHPAQLLTYLKASGKPLGLLINFNVPVLKNGIKRLVNQHKNSHSSLRVSPRLSVSAGEGRPQSAEGRRL